MNNIDREISEAMNYIHKIENPGKVKGFLNYYMQYNTIVDTLASFCNGLAGVQEGIELFLHMRGKFLN